MINSEILHFLKLAEESHDAAKGLMSLKHPRFSAAQSYYTIFYLAQAVLLSKGLTFSSHSAVVACGIWKRVCEDWFAKSQVSSLHD